MLQTNLNSTQALVVIDQPRRVSETPSNFCCTNVRCSSESARSTHVCLSVACTALCGLSSGIGVIVGCNALELISRPVAVLLGLSIGGVGAFSASSLCYQLGEYISQDAREESQESLPALFDAPPPSYDEVASCLSDEECPPTYEMTSWLDESSLPSYAELFPKAQ